jgi:hypothetical protein
MLSYYYKQIQVLHRLVNKIKRCEISGSQRREYEGDSVLSRSSRPMDAALMMEAKSTSETSVNF